jgi:hypothetical protein
MATVAAKPRAPKTLDRRAWGVLAVVMVFLIADGYDTYVLLITEKPTLLSLLPASEHADITRYISGASSPYCSYRSRSPAAGGRSPPTCRERPARALYL